MLIRDVKIQNFKSISHLELNLGRINVLIGANGAGKSNILEAIALASAAANNQLNNEFLVPRGIRVPDDPRFMRAAFKATTTIENIEITLQTDEGIETICVLDTDNETGFPRWRNINEDGLNALARPESQTLIEEFEQWVIAGGESDNRQKEYGFLGALSANDQRVIGAMLRRMSDLYKGPQNLRHFLIYSPEYPKLRTFEGEGQIEPLGIGGEGLFKLLRVLATQNPESIQQIKEKLAVVGWFEDFEAPTDNSSLERSLRIKDRYLDQNLAFFNQKSSNEGFLFLLFYYCLFLSKDTPEFFAVDNIDASLNPKLCVRLMKDLVELAASSGKQVIFTTHNPAILDGLDLTDDEQRLFAVSRSATGETQVRRVKPPREVKGTKPVALSEAFVKGFLGGLPNNF